jgi:hypothetical protein
MFHRGHPCVTFEYIYCVCQQSSSTPNGCDPAAEDHYDASLFHTFLSSWLNALIKYIRVRRPPNVTVTHRAGTKQIARNCDRASVLISL